MIRIEGGFERGIWGRKCWRVGGSLSVSLGFVTFFWGSWREAGGFIVGVGISGYVGWEGRIYICCC